MAYSSETLSIVEQIDSTAMLNIKANQNLVLDLNSSRYYDDLKPMIKYLKYSPITQYMIMAETVPMVHLSNAYSFAFYNQNEWVINFEIDSHKISVTT
ncbi:unnamed protein product [Lactuca saligna]|uniref:Uncharacterized protein n=1 Tax=Lactuca saligna TaxID=75948 RepID=A0AA35YXM0_LACSI|nr:unnamed protein product [Lactuca saligna]